MAKHYNHPSQDCLAEAGFTEQAELLQSLSGGSYANYRLAGELFGRLRKALAFGELVMFTRTWGQAMPPQAIAFQWRFKAGGQDYQCEHTVSMIELTEYRSLEVFANRLADEWKYLKERERE